MSCERKKRREEEEAGRKVTEERGRLLTQRFLHRRATPGGQTGQTLPQQPSGFRHRAKQESTIFGGPGSRAPANDSLQIYSWMFCQIFVRHEVYRDCRVCLGYRVFKDWVPSCSCWFRGVYTAHHKATSHGERHRRWCNAMVSISNIPLHPTIPVNNEGLPLSAPAPDTSWSRLLCIAGILIHQVLPFRGLGWGCSKAWLSRKIHRLRSCGRGCFFFGRRFGLFV